MMLTWWQRVLGFCLPSMCLSCQKQQPNRGCCHDCYQVLPWLTSCCLRCATPIEDPGICGQCVLSPPAFSRVVIPFAYAPPLNQWLSAFKFHAQLEYGVFLTDCLWQVLQAHYDLEDWPQLLIAVPLHRQRLQRRGYNQALLVALRLARLSGIAVARRAVLKTRVTEAQTTLTRSRRRNNVKRAFSVTQSLPVSHVAIVDDILTTGATADELANTLIKSGVQRVDLWCIARTTLES